MGRIKPKETLISKMQLADFEMLKQRIGHDYSGQLQKFIIEKNGREYGTGYLIRSLNFKQAASDKIVLYAMELAEKVEKERDELVKRSFSRSRK